jgi:hypothetical protein
VQTHYKGEREPLESGSLFSFLKKDTRGSRYG